MAHRVHGTQEASGNVKHRVGFALAKLFNLSEHDGQREFDVVGAEGGSAEEAGVIVEGAVEEDVFAGFRRRTGRAVGRRDEGAAEEGGVEVAAVEAKTSANASSGGVVDEQVAGEARSGFADGEGRRSGRRTPVEEGFGVDGFLELEKRRQWLTKVVDGEGSGRREVEPASVERTCEDAGLARRAFLGDDLAKEGIAESIISRTRKQARGEGGESRGAVSFRRGEAAFEEEGAVVGGAGEVK